MKPSQSNNQQDNDVDITPMLDIVFIILIFFVVTASFVQEKGMAVNKSSENKHHISVQPSIVLALDQNGEVRINQREVDVRLIKSLILTLKNENPDADVVVHVHQKTRLDKLVGALDALHSANVFQPPISLAKG